MSGLISKFIFVACIGVIVITGCSSSQQQANKTVDPAASPSVAPPGAMPPPLPAANTAPANAAANKPKGQAITSTALTKAYADNESSADAKYKRQTLAVTGRVIGVDYEHEFVVVTLAGHISTSSTQCSFRREDRARVSTLREGQTATLSGFNYGLSIGNYIDLQNCTIVPQ